MQNRIEKEFPKKLDELRAGKFSSVLIYRTINFRMLFLVLSIQV